MKSKARRPGCKRVLGSAIATLLLPWICLASHTGPFDGQVFRGRIAWSADGNHNDPDDWAASPFALAILAEGGVKDRLVHFDYNCILPETDLEWESIHKTSVLGAAQRYRYDPKIFFDCRNDVDAAVNHLAEMIDASSAEDPLYFILAGPMEVPYLGIIKSDPAKRPFVYCISHSRWNDGFATRYQFKHSKRSVIPLGIKWIQITDQNQFLSHSPYGRPARPEEWRPWHWLRDAADPKLSFLWERMRVSTRPDCSDAGMAYFLLSGDDQTEMAKLRRLLENNESLAPPSPRQRVRIEAENFQVLTGYELDHRNDRQVSHRISVRLAHPEGEIRTSFHELYVRPSAHYDVAIRYFDQPGGRSRLLFLVNGERRGDPWTANDGQWATHLIPDVLLRQGDQIGVKVQADGTEEGRIDYVELVYNETGSNREAQPAGSTTPALYIKPPARIP